MVTRKVLGDELEREHVLLEGRVTLSDLTGALYCQGAWALILSCPPA